MAAPQPGPGTLGENARGLVFVVLMYGLLAVMGTICLIPSWLSRDWALFYAKTYCRWVLWLLRVVCGTRVEIRGTPPHGPCIVAAKHQAFLDILVLVIQLPRPAFVMKRSLKWVPFIGVYAERLGCIAIDRSAGHDAVRSMLEGAGQQAAGRQIVIFPQGTRVAPGVEAPYRPGVLRLYQQLAQPIALVALNTGWFWPRTGLRRSPGTVVVEFLGEIPPGRDTRVLIDEIAGRIETASDRLAEETADAARQ